MTQQQLMIVSGIPGRSISLIESTRKHDFLVSTLETLATALNVKLDDLCSPGKPADRAKLTKSDVMRVHSRKSNQAWRKNLNSFPPPPDDPADDIVLGEAVIHNGDGPPMLDEPEEKNADVAA